ncbi:MAG: iron ABC transporter [Bacteroidia bacterium]|nr:MAG: iron ABC transporter [Bacteroidia bacterium]
MKTRKGFLFFILAAAFVLLLFLNLATGSGEFAPGKAWKYIFGGELSSTDFLVYSQFRLPRTLTAVLAGWALSVAGLQMQTIFNNPLAGPYVLGISSGAGLGVALLLLSSFTAFALIPSEWMLILAAWTGAGGILLVLFLISLRIKDVLTILIIGVLFGSATGAVISILEFFSSKEELKTFVLWTMGSIGGISRSQLQIFIPVIAAGFLISLWIIPHLNLLYLGEEYAKTSGMKVSRVRTLIFISTGILAGTVTAFCGPVAFVGIIVPHLARSLFQTADHKYLIPASALIGALLILTADILSLLPTYNGTLPINSVTAVLGIPIVIKIVIDAKI